MPGPKAYIRAPHDAGWSSPVARQAHNLKVTGSNPVPATIRKKAGLATGLFRECHRRSRPKIMLAKNLHISGFFNPE
jgi:hypothetical protein